MKFFGRKDEIDKLTDIYNYVDNNHTQISLITGIEGIGKTSLVLEATKEIKTCYIKISKKEEVLICEEFLAIIEETFKIPVVSNFKSFDELFSMLIAISKKRNINVIIDEFHLLNVIHPGILEKISSMILKDKKKTKLNLMLISSSFKEMKIIQKQSFKKIDNYFHLVPFTIEELSKILQRYKNYSADNLLHYYLFTGGVPKYISIFIDNKILNAPDMLSYILIQNSPFLEEGLNRLIKIFGRDHGTYFSILQMAAVGTNTRSKMESKFGKNIGGYLKRLENDYDLIRKEIPVNAPVNARRQQIIIKDQFLRFWFRFINRNYSAIESGDFSYFQSIQKDFTHFKEETLKDMFIELYKVKSDSIIGRYWERKDGHHLDLVILNKKKKKMTIAEIKLKGNRINLDHLQRRAENMTSHFEGYNFSFLPITLNDLDNMI